VDRNCPASSDLQRIAKPRSSSRGWVSPQRMLAKPDAARAAYRQKGILFPVLRSADYTPVELDCTRAGWRRFIIEGFKRLKRAADGG
jgi:hypothetical protein